MKLEDISPGLSTLEEKSFLDRFSSSGRARRELEKAAEINTKQLLRAANAMTERGSGIRVDLLQNLFNQQGIGQSGARAINKYKKDTNQNSEDGSEIFVSERDLKELVELASHSALKNNPRQYAKLAGLELPQGTEKAKPIDGQNRSHREKDVGDESYFTDPDSELTSKEAQATQRKELIDDIVERLNDEFYDEFNRSGDQKAHNVRNIAYDMFRNMARRVSDKVLKEIPRQQAQQDMFKSEKGA